MTVALERGWVVSSTPRPHYTPRKDLVPILQEAEWTPGPVWTGRKSRPHRDFFLYPFYSRYLGYIPAHIVTDTVVIFLVRSVHISRDIITPYSTEHFDLPLLSYIVPVIHFAHTTLPPHFTLRRKARWHNLRAMYRADYVLPPPKGPVFAYAHRPYAPTFRALYAHGSVSGTSVYRRQLTVLKSSQYRWKKTNCGEFDETMN